MRPIRTRCGPGLFLVITLSTTGLIQPAAQSELRKPQQGATAPATPTAEAQAAAAQAIKDAKSAAEQANAAATGAAQAATKASQAAEAAAQAAQAAAALVKTATDANQQATEQKLAADQSTAAAKASNNPPTAVLGDDNVGPKDYVPCLFDRQTLLAMRGYGNPTDAPVSDKQANDVLSDAIASVSSDPDTQEALLTTATDKLSKKLVPMESDVIDALSFTLDSSLLSGTKPEKKKQVVAKAKSDLTASQQQFTRSKYIACSMSIFPWDLSHMIFGRTVANHYLAVQVIVRNLDQDHEYLIHDSELAVDAYSGQLERFQASHEKEAVRAVVVYGQNYDLHAVWSHMMEGVGMIGGAIVGLPQPSIDQLTQASGAYNAAWIPTFQKLFPDLTTNNLNNLNDLGFSAASSSRIVVPKAGAVPFVIFVPVAPLEQACWLQKGYTPTLDVLPKTACDAIYNTDEDKSPSVVPDSTNPAGVKISAPVDWSRRWFNPVGWFEKANEKKWPMNSKKVGFKHWTPVQLTALQKHAYAVVAGSLIQQVNDTTSLRAITCGTPDSDGKVYLATVVGDKATAKNPLNCSLTGSALDSMTNLRLEDATGTKIADAPVTPGADATTAKAIIAVADVPKLLVSTYELFSVDKTGAATDLKQSLSLVPPPIISAAPTVAGSSTPTATTLNTGFTLTLTGTNLDQVTQVQLVLTAAPGTTLTSTSQTCLPAQCTVVFGSNAVKQGETYEVKVGVGPSKVGAYDVGQALGALQ